MATCLSIAAPFLKTFSGTHLFINYKCRTSYKSFAINFKRCLARIPYTTTYIPASILVYRYIYTTATATTPACFLLLLKKQRLLSACCFFQQCVRPALMIAFKKQRPPLFFAHLKNEKQRWPRYFQKNRGGLCFSRSGDI